MTHTLVCFDRDDVPWLIEIQTPSCNFTARRDTGTEVHGRVTHFYGGTQPALTVEAKNGSRTYVRLAKMTTVSPKFPVKDPDRRVARAIHRTLSAAIKTDAPAA